MQISAFETTEGLERRLAVGIEASEIEQKIDKRLQELAKTAKIDGFRPGKVPLNFIKKRFHKGVRAEVIDEAIQESFRKALEEKEVRPASRPNVEVTKDQDGEDVSFVATFEIYPEVSSLKVAEMSVEKPVADPAEDDIEKVLTTWRKSRAKWNEVDRAAADGDQVTMDYICVLDGEEIEEGSGKDAKLVLGDHQLLPEFEAAVVGKKAGDKSEAKITLPEGHAITKLAGQEVQLNIEILKVEAPELPEVDEQFVKDFGVEDGSVEKLREQIKDSLVSRLETAQKEIIKQALFEQIVDKHEVEVPKSMVDSEMDFVKERNQHRQMDDDAIRDEATKSVKLGLLIGQYVQDHKIEYEQERLFAAVKQIAMGYQNPSEIAQKILQNEAMTQRLIASVLEEQAVEKLIEEVKIDEVSKPFDDVIKMAEG